MEKDNSMFVVLVKENFTFEHLNKIPIKIPVEIDVGKMIGYLPIYATREDALADYPNSILQEIKETKKVIDKTGKVKNRNEERQDAD